MRFIYLILKRINDFIGRFSSVKINTAVVIGTSNSIMRNGWVNLSHQSAEAVGWEFRNISIGGSSSRYGAYKIETGDLPPGAARIIVDFCVNDQMFLDKYGYSLEHVVSHYASMIMALKARGDLHRLLVVMFPQQQVRDDLFETLRNLLDCFGVDYIDFRETIETWVATGKVALNTIYSDPRHFSAPLQARIGVHILTHLQKSKRTRPTPAIAAALKSLDSFQPVGYRPLELQSTDAGTVITVGTSVLQQRVTRFSNGDQFTISGASLLLGAYVWVTPTSGVITLRGDNLDLRLHFRRAFKNIFLFDTFNKPFQLQQSTLVDVCNDKSAPFQTMLGQTSSVYDDTNSLVDIVVLIGGDRNPLDLARDIKTVMASDRSSFTNVMGPH